MQCLSVRDAARGLLGATVVSAAVAAMVLAGCGRGSFVGRRADNLSAYYNTFYNARKAFAEGVQPLEELSQPIDQEVYLPVFAAPSQMNGGEAFDRAIKKSASLLRKHPRSKWVDDALLLIGKSYYYQQNYVGAERKFREVIDDGGVLTGEARFWLGRTLVSSGNEAAAEQHLTESLGREDLSDRWTAHLQLLLGDLRARQGAWSEAAEALSAGVGGVRDDQTRARAFFLRGQVLETMGRQADAADAYRHAAKERPRYELAYAARTSALRAAARSGGGAEALRRLRGLERDDKNDAKRADLALLRARLYQAQGQPGPARTRYRALLYPGRERQGALSPSAEVRGRAHYALATLYRDAYDDFTRAAAHFDTAATGRSSSAQDAALSQGLVPPYAITDSRRQAARYGRVSEASSEVARLDSLLRLGALDEEAFASFVDSLRRARAEAARTAGRQAARRQAEQGFQGRGVRGVEGQRGDTEAGASTAGSETSFLFHRNPAQMQQARRTFVRRWGERPRVPNWRRRRAISSQANAQAPGEPAETIGPNEELEGEVLPRVDVSAVPRTDARRRALRAEQATAHYNLGNALLLAAGRPDSARAWFQRVVEQGSDTSSVVRRARYALAEAERAAGRPEAARQQYREVVRRQPGTEMARRARQRLAEAAPPTARPPASAGAAEASSSPRAEAAAEAAYAQAYRQWQDHAYEQALQQMIDAAADHPESSVAPRALLAAARVFMEWSRGAGPPLAGPLPVQVPEALRATLAGPSAAAAAPAPHPAAADSAVAAPGSTAVADAADAVPARAAVADSAAAEAVGADSAATGLIAADSAASTAASAFGVAAADSAAADSVAADTVSAPRGQERPQEGLVLEGLLAGLAQRYPDVPHARRARKMLRALRERYPQRFAARSPAPGAGEVRSDSARSDSARSDSARAGATGRQRRVRPRRLQQRRQGPGGSAPGDSVQAQPAQQGAGPPSRSHAADDSTKSDGRAADSSRALAGQSRVRQPPRRPPTSAQAKGAADRVRASAGGAWALVVASPGERAEAEDVAERLRERLSEERRAGAPVVRVLPPPSPQEGVAVYRVAVGAFATREQAVAAQERLQSVLPAGARPFNTSPSQGAERASERN